MKTKNPIHMKFAAGLSRALAPSLVTLLALSSLSRAAVIADYNADFWGGGTPSPGWSYLWNDGAIGTEANYKPLAYWWAEGGAYLNSGTYPDPITGYAAAAHGPSGGYSHPGTTSIYTIAGYRVQSGEAGTGSISNSTIYIPYAASFDGVEVRVYVNDNLINTLAISSVSGSFDMNLGELAVGDDVYVAWGSGPTLSGDTFQSTYQINTIPEPSTAILTAIGLVGLLGRTRRRN
jgi:hypothetical protein